MSTSFDTVVVGAGPAGSAAALVLARAGKRVALLERGPWPGSKNMYGGVVYGRVLDTLLPGWSAEIPVQRWVTRRQTMVLAGEQSLSVDYRNPAWGRPPYNGATALRSELDAWLASKATDAGAELITSTVATGPLTDGRGRVVGVEIDRPGGPIEAPVVIACDGVNSLLAKAAGLYPHFEASHFTLGAKEVIALPREEIERRFGVEGDEGVDLEILGATGDVPGGGFVYTNADSVAVGVVLSLPGLAGSKRRPEEHIAALKAHPAIAPLVSGGDVKEYSAHLIPEAGYDALPTLAGDGILVAGDAAGLCLAAGLWLEGVNFALGSGMAAGRAAAAALDAGDTSAAGLAGYRRRLETSFVLADHAKLRRVPGLVLSERVQRRYPSALCRLAELVFDVDNPAPKVGLARAALSAASEAGLRLRDVAADAWVGARSFG